MVKYVPIFQNISARSKILLKKSAITKFVPKNTHLLFFYDKANYFYFIIDGWVKLYRNTVSGEEIVIDVLTKGSVFGEKIYPKENKYDYSAQAISDVNVISYPIDVLKECIDHDPFLASKMIRISNQKQQDQTNDIEHLIYQSAPQKIGCFLLRMCDQKKQLDVIIDLPYSKYLIAAKLGIKVETFSRSLTKLIQDTGRIKVKGSRVYIDNLDSLVNYVCDHCSLCFPCNDLPNQYEQEIFNVKIE
jgi:CRP-like cAMP-binding protein